MPYPSAIFIRDKALVVNIESMRLIICQDEVLVLSVPDAEHPVQPAFPTPDCPFVRDLVQRVSEQKLSFASDHNLHVDTSLPYELRALEAVLVRGTLFKHSLQRAATHLHEADQSSTILCPPLLSSLQDSVRV